jgi:cellulase/cellobiase CelA1
MRMTPLRDVGRNRRWIVSLLIMCTLLLGAFSLLLLSPASHNAALAAGTSPTPVSDPAVVITSPAYNAVLFVNQPVTITVEAFPAGSIMASQVKISVDGMQIGIATSAPYTATWTPTTTGAHTIMAAAVYSDGLVLSMSEPVTVLVSSSPTPCACQTPTPTQSPLPTVAITSPANGATIPTGTPITIKANATPVAGSTIASVGFYYLIEQPDPVTVLIGTATTAPYQITWNPPTGLVGSVFLIASTTDSVGREGQSPDVNIYLSNVTPTPTPIAGACQVHYLLNSQWTGGFSASVTISNTATTTINGWVLQFTFPGDQQITQIWNGSAKQSGEVVTITNLSYNGSIAPGGSTNLGFNGTWTHSDSFPTSFTLNGMVCTTV